MNTFELLFLKAIESHKIVILNGFTELKMYGASTTPTGIVEVIE